MDGCTERRMDICMDVHTDIHTDADVLTDVWVYGQTDKQTDGWTDRISPLYSTKHCPLLGPLPKRILTLQISLDAIKKLLLSVFYIRRNFSE